MNFQTYQQQALRTLNPQLSRNQILFNCAFGIIGEIGEVADFLKKQMFHQMRPTEEILADSMIRAKVKDELGDLCWYIAVLSHTFSKHGYVDQDAVAYDIENELFLLATRAGDLCEALRVFMFTNKDTIEEIRDHLGELLESVVDFSSLFGLSLGDILAYNVEKLKARHPEGFTAQYSSDSAQ